MRGKILGTLLFLIFVATFSYGQSAQVTVNALFRTFMIATNMGRGTAFSIDVDNREYWITAKHVFTGIRSGPAGVFTKKVVQANLLSQVGSGPDVRTQHWQTFRFRTIDPGKDIDILVLVPDHPLIGFPGKFNFPSVSSDVPMGGDCTFLGFPYGGGWAMKWEPTNSWMWVPYIKHCTVSGEIENNGATIWILDGINNEGFSGGPVLVSTGPSQRVFAVISGYYQEPLEVIPAKPGQTQASSVPQPPKLPGQQPGQPQKEIVEANSGFIIAFNLKPAIDAIRADPIGPLVPESAPGGKPKCPAEMLCVFSGL